MERDKGGFNVHLANEGVRKTEGQTDAVYERRERQRGME